MLRAKSNDVDRAGKFDKFREGKIGDPYASLKSLKEPTICPVCSAIYHKKRWQFNNKMFATLKRNGKFFTKVCPADKKIEDNYPMGIVTLSGGFLSEHQEDIMNLIKAEEKRAMQKNPLEKIMSINKKGGSICVQTTSEHLALRLGRKLSRTYKGTHDYEMGSKDKYITVTWARD